MEVVAAVIEQDGKVLIAQRALTGTLPGLWEFPGGKKEQGESHEQAIIRECREEMDVEVTVLENLGAVSRNNMKLTFFKCAIVSGQPEPREHEQLNFEWPCYLQHYTFCKSDALFLEKTDWLQRNAEACL